MTAKFTPGPWVADVQEDCGLAVVQDAHGFDFVELMGPHAPEDAHLIAAAPDLYEVCLESQRLVAVCAEHGFTVEADVQALFEHNGNLARALRKARGESQ